MQDIAFFRGNLYALLECNELLLLELGEGNNPVITDVKYVIKSVLDTRHYANFEEDSDEEDSHPEEQYLVQSGDQLLMAVLQWELDGG